MLNLPYNKGPILQKDKEVHPETDTMSGATVNIGDIDVGSIREDSYAVISDAYFLVRYSKVG